MDTRKEIKIFVNKIIPIDLGIDFDDLTRPDDGYLSKDVMPVLAFSFDILRERFDIDIKTIAAAFGYVHSQVVYYTHKADDLINRDHSLAWLHSKMVKASLDVSSELSSLKKKRSSGHNHGDEISKSYEASTRAKLASLTKGRLQRAIYLIDIKKSRMEVQESCMLTNQMYNYIKRKRDQIIKNNFKYIEK